MTDIWWLPDPHQQTGSSCVVRRSHRTSQKWADRRTDRRMDARHLHRPCSAYTCSINKLPAHWMAYLELVTHLLAYFTSSQVQLNSLKQWLSLNMTGVTDETYSLHRLTLVEMFNCIVHNEYNRAMTRLGWIMDVMLDKMCPATASYGGPYCWTVQTMGHSSLVLTCRSKLSFVHFCTGAEMSWQFGPITPVPKCLVAELWVLDEMPQLSTNPGSPYSTISNSPLIRGLFPVVIFLCNGSCCSRLCAW